MLIRFTIFIVILLNLSYAQSPLKWVLDSNTQRIQETLSQGVELSDGSFIFTGLRSDYTTHTITPHTFVWKLNNDLSFNSELRLRCDSFGLALQYKLTDIIEVGDSLLFTGKGLTLDSITALFYFFTDKNLNMGRWGFHSMNMLPPPNPGHTIGDGTSEFCQVKRHPDGGYYAAGSVNSGWNIDYSDTPGYRVFMRFDENMQLIRSSYQKVIYEYARPNIQYNTVSKMYFSGDITGQGYFMDSSFNLMYSTPDKFRHVNSTLESLNESPASFKQHNTQYLMANCFQTTVRINNDPDPEKAYYVYGYMMVKKFDQYYNIIDSTCMRPIDADSGSSSYVWDRSPLLTNLDFVNDDSLFFVYYTDKGFSKPGQYTLFMTDSLFKTRWAKKVVTPRELNLNSLLATKDGACLVFGYVSSLSDIGGLNWDIYIAKHSGTTGEITAVFTPPNNQNDLTLYPNPASTFINIPINCTLNLFGIDGKTVLSSKAGYLQKIDISMLGNGLYFYTLQDENHTATQTGKLLIQR